MLPFLPFLDSQDMFDSEYYECNQQTISNDVFHANHLTERTPIFVSPIPCTTPFWRQALQMQKEEQWQREPKRLRLSPTERNSVATTANITGSNDNSWWKPGTMDSDPNHTAVLAKFYYEQYASPNRVRLNEVVEIIGVLDHEEENSDLEVMAEEPNMMDWSFDSHGADGALSSIPAKTPRVHVLHFRSCLSLDQTPQPHLSPKILPSPHTQFAKAMSLPESPATAALYLTLLSRAEREQKTAGSTAFGAPSLTQFGTTLGCASLNLILPDVHACQGMQSLLEKQLSQLVPVFQSLSVTPEALASTLNCPAKRKGRIAPHALQFPMGSTLILNLSKMTPGKLSAAQTCALKGLQALTRSHKLDYQFEGNIRISFEADWRIIVLSTPATHKLLPCTMTARVSSAESTPNHENTIIGAMAAVRSSLQASMAFGNIALAPAVLQRAPQDFCKLREAARQQGNQRMIVEEDFHRWLTWCRLWARSRGSAVAEECDWEQAVALDQALVK